MEKFKFTILLALILAWGGMMSWLHWDDIKNTFTPDTSEVVQELNECQEPTVQQWLEIQQEYILQNQIDSVFCAMPPVTLVHIVTNIGTDLSIEDIVNIYLDNKPVYDNIEWGANKQKEIDTIPKLQKEQHVATPPDVINNNV